MTDQNSSNNQGSSRGLIIAIVVLAIVIVAAAAILIYLFLGDGAPSQETQPPTALPGPEVGAPTPLPDSATPGLYPYPIPLLDPALFCGIGMYLNTGIGLEFLYPGQIGVLGMEGERYPSARA